MVIGKCKNCGRTTEKHAKGMCITCYKKLAWKPKKKICKRCGRMMVHQAHGYCKGCYNYVFHLDNAKAHNYKRWHNIDIETYKRITQKCLICGFDKVVDLHHLDNDHKNNSEKNLIGLCPNHHKMLHDFKYKDEIEKLIKEKLDSK